MTSEEKRLAIELGKKLQKECVHDETIHTGIELWGPDDGSIKCAICGRDLGWWCPVSESHMCEYYGLHENSYYSFGQESWEDEDDCIFCHQPLERK